MSRCSCWSWHQGKFTKRFHGVVERVEMQLRRTSLRSTTKTCTMEKQNKTKINTSTRVQGPESSSSPTTSHLDAADCLNLKMKNKNIFVCPQTWKKMGQIQKLTEYHSRKDGSTNQESRWTGSLFPISPGQGCTESSVTFKHRNKISH